MTGFDRRIVSAGAVMAEFIAAGLVEAPDAHVANVLTRTGGEHDERVALAIALTMRAMRSGSVCLPIAQARSMARYFRSEESEDASINLDTLPWPDPVPWQEAIEASPLVTDEQGQANQQPLRCVDGNLYLERYWLDQEVIRTTLTRRATGAPELDETTLKASLDRLFLDDPREADQRSAVHAAVHGWTTVVAGGPGTGKTRTISRIVEAMEDQWGAVGKTGRIALAAPTGKAAARLTESFTNVTATSQGTPGSELRAVTVHRLLGARPDHAAHYGPSHHLPFDLVVVDEMSMVSLSLMARLLESLSDTTRLVMVGDPDQLTPVDAGAVLADITAAGRPRTPGTRDDTSDDTANDTGIGEIVELRHGFRFVSTIGDLADAIRHGDVERTLGLLRAPDPTIEFHEVDPSSSGPTDFPDLDKVLREQAASIGSAAAQGDAQAAMTALDRHRLLCAHRSGPFGVARWAALVEQVQHPILDEAAGSLSPNAQSSSAQLNSHEWFVGRPLLATQNQRTIDLANGDTGVVISTAQGLRAAMSNGRSYAPFVVESVDTMFAMTVHKAQGSQFDGVTVILPSANSPLLTRELLYTALTRARHSVRIIGTADAVKAAVSTPARRASGLLSRLRDGDAHHGEQPGS